MAHHLNYNEQTGKYSFMSVNLPAWHNLGQVIQHYPTSSEAIRYAGLDFEVAKRPNIHTLPSGNSIVSDNSFYTFRTDTEAVLGDKIGKDYHVVQNIDAFSFFDSIVGGKDGIKYETAGALGNAEIIFITAKLPEYIRVGREDLISQYLFLTSSHDGSGSISIAFTPIRVCCNNTLNAALKNNSGILKIRHTTSATDKLNQAHKLLGITNRLSVEMEAIYNRWARVRITDPELKRLIQIAMVPNKEVLEKLRTGQEDELSTTYNNIINNVYAYSQQSPTQQLETTKGTVFGAFNTISGYYQNVRDFKTEESKFKSIMAGTALARTQTAFNLCMDFTKIGGNALN
jgi:phage/plasmid-like protein (TIGR03299 family)